MLDDACNTLWAWQVSVLTFGVVSGLVVLAGDYMPDSVDRNYIIIVQTFTGSHRQSCFEREGVLGN